ncbi:MAG: hypothetical protein NTY10_02985 [Candidatus Omnitrophica bacterium]|nr:hypothetical protein [Candidatus Omnitrophota bacterium]
MENKFIFDPRIIRSPWGDFPSEREIEKTLEAYPDDYLKKISRSGYNAIWLLLVLRESVPSKLFPDNKIKKNHISCLNRLVKKVGRYGIKVYLYFDEPRSLRQEDPFWKTHPELKGQTMTFSGLSKEFDATYISLCTSAPAVKEYLEESSYNLFKAVPGLGGAFLITASEVPTHCYSHFPLPQTKFTDSEMAKWAGRKFICPRCAQRKPEEVAAEIITLVNRGIKSASPQANTIAWSWSWYILEPDPQKKLINLLPRDVILMSDLDRGGYIYLNRKRYPVDEYSHSYIGPSPRFKKQAALARKRGMKMMATIQISTSNEFFCIPYMPVPYLLAEKLKRMAALKINGYMGCWVTGGDASPMSRLAGIMSRSPQPAPGDAVKELARTEFGEKSARAGCKAWRKLSDAWQEYPFSTPFCYWGPLYYAAAYPLSLNLTRERRITSWCPLPRDEKGHLKLHDNNPAEWIKPFTSAVIISAFQKLLKGWEEGINILKQAIEKDRKNTALENELVVARHIMLSVQSLINIIRFYDLHRRWEKNKDCPDKALSAQLKKILEAEIVSAREEKELVKAEPRLGFYAEARVHLFTSADIEYKISLARKTISQLK